MEKHEYLLLACIGVAAAVLGGVLFAADSTTYGTIAIGLGVLVALSGVVGAMWNEPPKSPKDQ